MDETTIWIIVLAGFAIAAGAWWTPPEQIKEYKGWIVAGLTAALLFGVPWAVAELNEEKCDQWWELVRLDARQIEGPNVTSERALFLAIKAWEHRAPLWCRGS